jgi:beta-galactosidase
MKLNLKILIRNLAVLALLAFNNLFLFSQAKFPNILYGAAYYHEYMPYERLEKDIQLMKDAGISVVRVGESTWSLFEPQEGKFEFAWMDRIMDAMQKAGIKVILGTPTYSIPAWLYTIHPEILADYINDAHAHYGIRQNMDITNPAFRFYAERIIRKMMEHYAKHPAIIGYQVDNETTTYGASNHDFFVGFLNYMKNKYINTDTLNKRWGLQYWGMTLNGWDEFPTRDGATNPGYKLEWERYGQQVVADYLGWQAGIIREYKRSDQFITHDFMPLHPGQNYILCNRSLDFPALNVYHGSQDDLKAEDLGIADDFTRSVNHENFIITETNAQTIGWDSKGQVPPYDGQIRLCVYTHLAAGANMVEYWHWHSLHYGQETYWKGVIGHDLLPNRVYNEVGKTAHELKQIGSQLVNLTIKNPIGILYSMDSRHALKIMPFKDGDGYMDILKLSYNSLFKSNLGTDFIFTEKPDLKNYKLVIIPPLYIASDSLLLAISDYVRNGGHVIMFFKSGFCNEYSTVRWQKMPGLLSQACGFTYQEFSSIDKIQFKNDPFSVGKENNFASTWSEFIIPETAKPLAFYDHPFFGKYPAITTNNFGKGTLTYIGTIVSEAVMMKIVQNEVKSLSLNGKDENIQYPVVVRSGKNGEGKIIHYYLNYSSETHSIEFPYIKGKELLLKTQLVKGSKIQLNPWDLAIVEE